MKTGNMNEKKEDINKYNLVYIKDFERLHLPRFILGNFIKRYPEKVSIRKFLFKKLIDNPELSAEVLENLRGSSEDIVSIEDTIYKKGIDAETGDVYFDSYMDLTAEVIRSMNHSDIRNLLLLLLNSPRRSVMIKDLLSLPGFNPVLFGNGKIFLSFYDFTKKTDKINQCKIGLNIIKDGYSHRQDLGLLTYSVYKRRPNF
ncbi:MAG: hypothetical protein PHF67_01105 [Candidatus Nanoarchaeia archaeon]|nr:hypothetical protein [Candidatus Nanoarchaeia archaeon]